MRLFFVSFAFLPFQSQVSYALVKQLVALKKSGVEVELLTFDPEDNLLRWLAKDNELNDYVSSHLKKLYRIQGKQHTFSRYSVYLGYKDIASRFLKPALNFLLSLELSAYDAIVSVSPFHSVHQVLFDLKQYRKDFCWVAQFFDPWSKNPLESFRRNKMNAYFEKKFLSKADIVIHQTDQALKQMLPYTNPNVRANVISHVVDKDLYPQRNKLKNEKVTIRHVGHFFAKRNPEPLFKAFHKLLERRNDLKSKVVLEVIGDPNWIKDFPMEYRKLPVEAFRIISSTTYLDSLKFMYDADILILLETQNFNDLFIPSKLADYYGAETPIVAILPEGAVSRKCASLGIPTCSTEDLSGIEICLENHIDAVLRGEDLSIKFTDESEFSPAKFTENYLNVLSRE